VSALNPRYADFSRDELLIRFGRARACRVGGLAEAGSLTADTLSQGPLDCRDSSDFSGEAAIQDSQGLTSDFAAKRLQMVAQGYGV
jgi:hypothetical protein